jgi:hypothetical protein
MFVLRRVELGIRISLTERESDDSHDHRIAGVPHQGTPPGARRRLKVNDLL